MGSFAEVHDRLAPLRRALLAHPVYVRVSSLESLHVFMQHHVFAVWDFMSLLKSLQLRLSSVAIPWLPPTNREGCRLVNEIVLAEESDEDGDRGFASHFDLYHQAMQRCGADTSGIDAFLAALGKGLSVRDALAIAEVPTGVRQFVLQTFAVIDGGNLCEIAAAFAFGREDLLPDLFRQIVEQLNSSSSNGLAAFQYYLERHIDMDGDQHGPMAGRLVDSLCSGDEANWRAAETAAVRAFESRLQLWDSIQQAVDAR